MILEKIMNILPIWAYTITVKKSVNLKEVRLPNGFVKKPQRTVPSRAELEQEFTNDIMRGDIERVVHKLQTGCFRSAIYSSL